MELEKQVIKIDEKRIQTLFGQYDKNIRKIEKAFNITYVYRGDSLTIEGSPKMVEKACTVIKDLLVISNKEQDISHLTRDYVVGSCD